MGSIKARLVFGVPVVKIPIFRCIGSMVHWRILNLALHVIRIIFMEHRGVWESQAN